MMSRGPGSPMAQSRLLARAIWGQVEDWFGAFGQ
jgi:hypothetical protein